MLPGSSTHETIIPQMGINPILGGHEKDNLNSVPGPAKEDNLELEVYAPSSAKEGASNSDKPASQLTPETNNPNSRTSEVNGPKPEAIASQTSEAANSNFGASEVDGSEPKAIASHLEANLNSSTATPDSNKKSVTGIECACNNLLYLRFSDPQPILNNLELLNIAGDRRSLMTRVVSRSVLSHN